jgi:DNA-binding SARP family transcriptional activator
VLREAVAAEPLDEAAGIDLMRALAAVGRRGEALQAFESLRVQLRNELGIAPSATLLEVADELARTPQRPTK